MYWILSLVLLSTTAMADIGKVVKISGKDAYIIRAGKKLHLKGNFSFKENDSLHTYENQVIVHLYPSTQVLLAKDTVVKLTENKIQKQKKMVRTYSSLDLVKGLIRVKILNEKNQETDLKVQTEGAIFSARGTEFDVAVLKNKDVNLDVLEGQLEASSPFIQSFVPEYVKTEEGLTFSHGEKKFIRRPVIRNFKDKVDFLNRSEIKASWKKANIGK